MEVKRSRMIHYVLVINMKDLKLLQITNWAHTHARMQALYNYVKDVCLSLSVWGRNNHQQEVGDWKQLQDVRIQWDPNWDMLSPSCFLYFLCPIVSCLFALSVCVQCEHKNPADLSLYLWFTQFWHCHLEDGLWFFVNELLHIHSVNKHSNFYLNLSSQSPAPGALV